MRKKRLARGIHKRAATNILRGNNLEHSLILIGIIAIDNWFSSADTGQ